MSKANQIYVVTAGVYSDYHICGVFTSKLLAKKFIASFSGSRYSPMEIETYTLNPFEAEIKNGLKACFIRMDREGNASDFRWEDDASGFVDGEKYSFDVRGNLFNYCFAKDEKHATKITNELRARLIAENKWRGVKEKTK